MRRDLSERYDSLPVQRTLSLLAIITLIVALGGGVSVGVASDDAGIPVDAFEQMDVDPDDVLIEVTVDPDGDAVWEIQYRIRLATDDEEQAFEELREDIDADPDAYTDRFRERMVATADAAETATGREMAVTETTVTAERRELPQSYGVITYQFRWSGFAAVDGDRLAIGDAIDGLFLDDASSLILSWPDGYGLIDAEPSPDETRDGAVVWVGPVDFTGGEPRMTAEPDGGGIGLVALLVAGLLILVGGAVAYRRHRGGSASATGDGERGVPPAESESGARGSDGAAGSAETIDTAGTPEETAETASADEPAETGEVNASDESGNAGAPPVDEALLSNEEQVLRLVESSGGRMKQKRVAEELDWTAAKTSQVVTGLRDENELDGFRLGRENVLSLPEYDMDADDSVEETDDEES